MEKFDQDRMLWIQTVKKLSVSDADYFYLMF